MIEERLSGPEASVIAICDGTRAVALPAARDHKRLCDDDRGPNTGGMGAYSPLPDLDDAAVDEVLRTVHLPILAELARRGTPFRGFLYAGLMLTDTGPVLLETNVRLGDPEAQAILPRLAGDLAPVLAAAAARRAARRRSGHACRCATRLPSRSCWPPRATRATRAAATPIDGIGDAIALGALVFHAGTVARQRPEGGYAHERRPGARRDGHGPRRPRRPRRRRAGRRRRRLARDAAPARHRRHPAGPPRGPRARRRPPRPGAGPMIRRYTLAEMGALWSDQARFERMLEVEIAVCRAQVRRGLVPASALDAIETKARVDVERIAEIEQTTDHDVIAFVSQVAETVGPDGRFLHLGLTSSDVVDTALALQLRAAGERLLAGADRLTTALIARARAEAGTVMMGRTHSVHAEPTTFGLKCAGWAFEVARGRERLAAATAEIATGKISGPVGTYSHLAPDLEAEVLAELGLRVDPVSTQIVQRDRHAAFLAAIAILGGTLERLATEVRNLQHTEIAEVMEPFRSGQKGSSAMPHKRNPILSERIAGLARLLRGYAQTAFENQPLWHERDISHSSAERVILPDATILLDYMLAKTTGLVEGLVVRPERMLENIERGHGLHASSRVLLALVETAGLCREDAYAIVQRNALRAADERVPLKGLLATDPARRGQAAAGGSRRLLRRCRRSCGTCRR